MLKYGCEEIYIKDGKSFEVKQIYIDISKIISSCFDKTEDIAVLDVGCASGELLFFLKQNLGLQTKPVGFDYNKHLIYNAISRFGIDDFEFLIGDVADFKSSGKFDVIVLTGVLACFDDFHFPLNNVVRHLKEGGLLLVFGRFNEFDIDVRIEFKVGDNGVWSGGYNLFRLPEVVRFIEKLGLNVVCKDFVLPFDLEKGLNPVKSWTVDLDGVQWQMNGLHLVHIPKFLICRKTLKS